MSLRTAVAEPATPRPRVPGGPPRPGFLRRHSLIIVLLLAGIALRMVTQLAYRPALLYVDSFRYLGNITSSGIKGSDPLGYTLFLRLLLHVPNLAVVAVVQHVMGLGLAVALYALLVRRGVRTWLAALAAAPVLLDAYILQIEQLVMSDGLFIALTAAALIALAWRRRPSATAVIVAGLALGAAMTVRSVGQPVVVVALVYAVATAGRGWRRRLTHGAALVAACAVPVASYAVWTAAHYGSAGLGSSHGRMMYGRAATFADCRGVDLPAYERTLCPAQPVGERFGVDEFMWAIESPAATYKPPPGMTKDQAFGDFAMRVYRHQPLDLARAVTIDFLRGFLPTKHEMHNQVSVKRWQFQPEYPETVGLDPSTVPALVRAGGDHTYADPALAGFLRQYQLTWGYLPGTAVGVSLLLGALAFAGVGRARRSPLRGACFVFTAGTTGMLLVTSFVEFSWRYQLPGVVLAPVTGALALTAMFARPRNADAAPEAAVAEGQPGARPRNGDGAGDASPDEDQREDAER